MDQDVRTGRRESLCLFYDAYGPSDVFNVVDQDVCEDWKRNLVSVMILVMYSMLMKLAFTGGCCWTQLILCLAKCALVEKEAKI